MTPNSDAAKAAADELYRRAAAVDVVATFARLNVKLNRAGRLQYRGACPACGGEDDSTRCAVAVRANSWHCFSCNKGGGPVQAWCAVTGLAVTPACEAITGEALPTVTRTAPAPASKRLTNAGDLPARMWARGKPIAGTIAEAWFAGPKRGLDPVMLRPFTAALRFDPRAYAGSERNAKGERLYVYAPALLAAIRNNAGELIGLHATYLTPDGRDKARLFLPVSGDPIPSRKIYGTFRDGVVALCTNHTDPNGGPLVVGEGLETVLSGAQWLTAAGAKCRPVATLALINMQGGVERDAKGCTDPLNPTPDPTAPPWTLRDPGHVVGLIDHDMATVTMRVQGRPAGVRDMQADATTRARMCAALFRYHWDLAGATSITTPFPPKGMDFNDAHRTGALKPLRDRRAT